MSVNKKPVVFWIFLAIICHSFGYAQDASRRMADAAKPLSVVSSAHAQEEFIYDSKGRRDPFLPLVTSDGRLLKLEIIENPSGLTLEGIIIDEKALSYAIVNGIIVKVGDEVNDYKVFKIEKDRVLFVKDGVINEIVIKKE